MTRQETPLPELERELVAAARRIEKAPAARRRAWLHGWTLVSILLATTGVAGVAVARVAEVGPFAYLGRFGADNPKTAPVAAITVQPAGAEPAWQAIAVVDKLGRLCFTGGPRDPRTSPKTGPTERDLNNPPQAGYTCSDDSDEAAETLVDPDYPGATFGGSSPFNGSPDAGRGAVGADGKFRSVPQSNPTTKLVVYAVAPADLGTVAARWSTGGEPIPMQRSKGHLRLKVDKSPEGLDPDEQAQVARYPDTLDLVLWAAVVDIPEGVKQPQVSFPAELPPHGVPDNVVELLDGNDMTRLYEEGKKSGFRYDRGITREPAPVKRESAAERKTIGAFARPHSESDDVPTAERPHFLAERNRVQYGASRKLSITGGGLDGEVWLVPGALREEAQLGGGPTEVVCTLGPAILGQCKYNVGRWKEPLVEAVTCAQSFATGETFVWALTPPRTKRIELLRDGAVPEELPLGELIALRRQYADQPTSIRWYLEGDQQVTTKVPWAKQGVAVCGKKAPAYTGLRLDNAGTSSMGGGPPLPVPSRAATK